MGCILVCNLETRELIVQMKSEGSRQRPRKANGADKVQRQSAGEFSLAQRNWSFCSIQASTAFMRSTGIMEGTLDPQSLLI